MLRRSELCSPRRRAGNVAAIVALSMPVLIGVTALGLDTGLLYVQRRQAQTAAEAAALAGAWTIKNGGTFSSAQTAAAAAGTQNGITVTTSQVTQPQTGYVAVSVTATQPRLFSALWGAGNMSTTATATARASNTGSSGGSSGSPYSTSSIILLNKTAPSGLYVVGSASLTATGGGIQVNSNAAANPYNSSAFYVSQATVTAPSIAVVGTTWVPPYSGSATISPSVSAGTVVLDPLANASTPISAPSLSAAQALGSYTNYSTGNGRAYTMSPGYYSGGVNIGASTVTMNPGTYYLAGGDFYVANNATVTGTGVTIYLAQSATSSNVTYPESTGAVSIQSASSVTLSAPSSGAYAGLLFYVDAKNSAAVQFGNNPQLNLTGTIYAPSSQVDVTGFGGQTVTIGSQIIADTMRVENNAKVNVAYVTANVATPSGSGSATSTFALVK
jgi:hypothetical protein